MRCPSADGSSTGSVATRARSGSSTVSTEPHRTAAIVQELKGLEGPLLPILHGIQEEFGHVPQDALPVIAEALNISKA